MHSLLGVLSVVMTTPFCSRTCGRKNLLTLKGNQNLALPTGEATLF